MKKMKATASLVAVIGDLVSSRDGDRRATHQALLAALSETEKIGEPIESAHPTVGDEIQAIYLNLDTALDATLHLRLALLDRGLDMRFGIGIGRIDPIDPDRSIQDGPAWWAAREAITTVHDLASTPGYAGIRTQIRHADDIGPNTDHLNAFAHLIDSHISALRSGTHVSLMGILRGDSNATTAKAAGISESANSQRVNGNNLKPLADAVGALREYARIETSDVARTD